MLVRTWDKIKLKFQQFVVFCSPHIDKFLKTISWDKYKSQYIYLGIVLMISILSIKYKNIFGGAISILLIFWGYDRFLKKA